MDKALTVIIPAYNVSQYIEQGMDSLLAEPSILPYLDIIIVNDGSTDDTLEKVNKYVSRYPESVSIIDKKNGGHGSGINVGIKAARGKYLKVLDGDDWVKPDGLRDLVNYIVESKDTPDAIINPFEKVWEDGKRETIVFEKIGVGVPVGFKEIVGNGYTMPLHTLTIRSGIYRENIIPQIDEKISYDDMEYILYPVPYIKTIVFLEKTVYEYRLGLSGQSMNPEQMKKKLPMHTKVIESLAEYYRNNKDCFNEFQNVYFIQQFIDTLATNINIQLWTDVDYERIKACIEKYYDFPLKKTVSRRFKLLISYKKIGFYILRMINLR